MAILLLDAGMSTALHQTTSYLRKLILGVFPDADVRHKHVGAGDVLEVDGRFALLRSWPESRTWAVCLMVHRESVRTIYGTQPHSIEYQHLVEGTPEKAVEWIVGEVAQGRLRTGQEVQS